MKTHHRGTLRGISLLLAITMLIGLAPAGYAHTANHPTHPTETKNTATCQINNTAQAVTFTQTAMWTDESAGEAAVELSFDGASYVMKELKGYDFALLFDGSCSPNETASKESAKLFVTNVLEQNPDARFAVIHNSHAMGTYIQDSNNAAEIHAAISSIPWPGGTDFVAASCEYAYDLHEETGRDNPLMLVIIGDGDWAYTPAAWSSEKPYTFTTMHRGAEYEVEIRTDNKVIFQGAYTYNGETYYDGGVSAEGWNTSGSYAIKKDGVLQSYPSANIAAAWAHALYLRHRADLRGMREKVAYATICTPKFSDVSYQATLNQYPFLLKGRIGADEGLNFEITENSQTGYINAFAEFEETLTTKVVTMNTTIDNRYFTVDEAALAGSLPGDCTYTLTSATVGTIPVQRVEIICTMRASQSLLEAFSIPVTIHADIPAAAFKENEDYLPVVYDGAVESEIAGCLFTDLEQKEQDIRTRKVFVDASAFAPKIIGELFEAWMETDQIILRGNWANETTGYITFWASYDGGPIDAEKFDYLTLAEGRLNKWKDVFKFIHTYQAPLLTGVTTQRDGKVYSQVRVPVLVHNSGVSTLSLVCENRVLATAYTITPGDVVGYGNINVADLGEIARVINRLPNATIPLPGLANDFAFEMMDIVKDGIINTQDLATVARLINDIIAI